MGDAATTAAARVHIASEGSRASRRSTRSASYSPRLSPLPKPISSTTPEASGTIFRRCLIWGRRLQAKSTARGRTYLW